MLSTRDRSLVIWRGKHTRGREGNEILREWGDTRTAARDDGLEMPAAASRPVGSSPGPGSVWI